MLSSVFQHLLPNGRAFRITVDKYLRKLFAGLSEALLTPFITAFDTVFINLLPESTALLSRWQRSLGLMYPYPAPRTELADAWGMLGGQTPAYIQSELHKAGFTDLYVHEAGYFHSGSWTFYNPLDYLWPSTIPPDPLPAGLGYPLVNKVYRAEQLISAQCMEDGIVTPDTQCNDQESACGYYQYSVFQIKQYEVPTGMGFWPYFIYIGGETFGDIVYVDSVDRERLEDLCLKLCPTHNWIGLLVSYEQPETLFFLGNEISGSNKAAQYYDGNTWSELSLTTNDITLYSGNLANYFSSVYDADENCYILCCRTSSFSLNHAKIIKIDKNGNKKSARLAWNYSGSLISNASLILHKDQTKATVCNIRSSGNALTSYFSIPLYFDDGDLILEASVASFGGGGAVTDIYSDAYFWIVAGTTIRIYDYTTKLQLDSETVDTCLGIACDSNNTCYAISVSKLDKFVFDGISTITKTNLVDATNAFLNAKQVLVDKWGDIIILTNSGTASTLLKYTAAGVQVATALDLGGVFYSLSTDASGYYYSNSSGTYKITKNTAAGQEFTGVGTKIRDTGMTTYGNNITGYQPAVYA